MLDELAGGEVDAGLDQVTQVDSLLPKAASLTSELEKPQVDAGKLPQLASNLADLQRQAGALKGLVR